MKQDMELHPYPRQEMQSRNFQVTYAVPTPMPLPILFQPVVPSMSPTPYPPQRIGSPVHDQSGPILGALEYLAPLNKIFVNKKIELVKACIGSEASNKYRILDPQSRQILFGKEDAGCCTRQCCGNIHLFDMKLLDGNKQEVMHFVRPLACGWCCFPCCLQSIEVQAPPGNAIGTVEEKWSIIYPKYDVKDASGKTVYYIEGPCCTFSCLGSDTDFKIYNDATKSQQVGKISKKWSGLAKEFFTDAVNFGIDFPPDADPKMKAVLMGACMLIDFMYFEIKRGSLSES